MRRLRVSFRGRQLSALVAVLVSFALAVGALAYFTSSGTGTAAASIGSIVAPSNVTVQQTGANVAISWNAATLSSSGSVQGYRVKRSDGTTVCGTPTLVTSLSCTDTGVPTGTYTYTVTAVYHTWTSSTTSAAITILTTPAITSTPSNPSAQSAPSFSFSGGGGSGYQCQLDGGSFTACSSPKSYNALADGSHTFKVHASQGGSSGPDASYTWTINTTAPSITAKPSNPSASASPSFSFSHTQPAYTFKCQLDGSGFTACTSPKSYSGQSDGSHTFQVEAVSADSATTTVATYTWTIDTTAPTDALSLASGAQGAFLTASGTTLYYKGNANGSFKLVDSVTDSDSGPASASFPAISTTGWTHNAETVSSGSGSPPTIGYTSSTFSWTATPSNPSAYSVTSKDNAGNTSGGVTPAFVSDTSAPAGGAVSVNGTAASNLGPVSYSASTGFSIGSRSDYTEAQSSTQSGLASSKLTVQSETLSNGSCGAAGSGGPFTSATTITGTTQPGGIVTGFCYLYTLTGTDNVGNAASISTTVVVDTSTPTTPTLGFSGLSANAFYASGNNTLYFRPAAGGTYTVTASSTAPSGIASYTFSSLAGNNFTGTQTGGQDAYTFGATATQPGSAPTVLATDNAGTNSSNASYNLVKDTSAPAGGAVSVNGTAATGAGSTSSLNNSTTFTIGSRTDYTETQSGSQSGLASSTLTVESETLSGSTCGAPGSGGPFTSATTITGTTQPSGIVAGFCYLYTLTGTDNVGNAASISTTVVDNSVSFTVTAQPSSVTAGVATSTNAITLTAIKNGATDTSYAGSTLTWGGANNSPSGATPTLPTNPTWTSGQASFGITLVKAENETLTVSDGTRSATFAQITVGVGAAARLAWTHVAVSAGTLSSPCFFTCTDTALGNFGTFKANVSVTDSTGNTVTNLGAGHTVSVTNVGGSIAGGSLTISSAGNAESTTQFTFTAQNGSWTSDSLTAATSGGTTYTSATASVTKQ